MSFQSLNWYCPKWSSPGQVQKTEQLNAICRPCLDPHSDKSTITEKTDWVFEMEQILITIETEGWVHATETAILSTSAYVCIFS